MSYIERCVIVLLLGLIAICSVVCIGAEYFVFLAAFELLIGIIIGMVVFSPRSNK